MKGFATRGLAVLALVSVFSLSLGACKKSTSTSPITPTPAMTTEDFSGSFEQKGSVVHSFSVAATGSLSISLTEIAPLSTMALGLAIGSWDGTNCTVVSQNDNARVGSGALSGTAVAGNFCAKVYDSGNVWDTATITYKIQVVHP